MTSTLHLGDALQVLPTLREGIVDAVITDPPYNSGGRTSSERVRQTARGKYVSSDAQHDLPSFDGDNRDQRSYKYWMTLILGQCRRVAKPSGVCVVFTDWRQLPTTTDALQAAGWTWRGVATWHKPAARPQRGRFKQDCEYVVWGSNGPINANNNPVYLPGLFTGSQPRGTNRSHITQKPLDVMQQLVAICPPDGTILDPFTGSGTTGVAAITQGRNFIGIELSEHYHAIAQSRLALVA